MSKKPIQALNVKARAIQALAEGEKRTVQALQDGPTNMPVGCTTIFDTGWETNPRPTYPVGNCQASVKRFLVVVQAIVGGRHRYLMD